MTERIKAVLDAVTAKVLAYRSVDKGLAAKKTKRKVRCRMEWVSSIHDKATRARGFQARASMGNVFFEPGADLSEFLVFPAGKHDDEVDVAGLMGRVIDQAHPAMVPIAEKPKVRDLWGKQTTIGDKDWMVG